MNTMRGIRYGEGRRRRGYPPMRCVCPQCGYTVQKTAAMPCRSLRCTQCGMYLVGE
ncbi:MAG: hypothetical protein QCH35_04710 [Methanomicrobiaceae archaeon]|nr:hypothetical protein [Methanomicrobiaceae archaeon]